MTCQPPSAPGTRRTRRICWPEFDAVCLEGGCTYCSNEPSRAVSAIRRRLLELDDPTLWRAFDYGYEHDWHGR